MATSVRKANQLAAATSLSDTTLVIIGDPVTGEYLHTNLGALKAWIQNGTQPADTTPPTIVSRTTGSATTIIITFSEAVLITSNLGWSFTKNGSALGITGITGGGTNTLTFTVAAMVAGDTILASYNSSAGNTRDASNNPMASFTNQPVTNNLQSGGRAHSSGFSNGFS